MEFHIGELIRLRAKSLRIGPTELGLKIETSKQNVYGIFKRRSIDTELLSKICKALDFDFFLELSRNLEMKSDSFRNDSANKEAGNKSSLMQELEYLRRINALLEENNSHLKQELNKF